MKHDTHMLPESFSLAGRRALITGSARGIGRALAFAFARAGAAVAVHGSAAGSHARDVTGAITAENGAAFAVNADLSADDGARLAYGQAVAALGAPPDILVCNASVQIPKNWLSVTREDFERQVAVNWRASYELCQLAAPTMQAAKWGRILMIGSVQEISPHPDMAIYAGTKCAQTSLAMNLARQLAPHGITVNNLAPGVILTDRNTNRLESKEYAVRVLEKIPAGFFGETHDCVGAALLLCSNAGRYITGQTLLVDGGMSLS